MYVYFSEEQHEVMELAARIELRCKQLNVLRRIREVRGWYKGDVNVARVSIWEGRRYVARQEENNEVL